MKPTKKSSSIENILTSLAGISRKENMEVQRCILCAELIADNPFKDSLSVREYQISGIGQCCQDKTFGI